ncbi:alpha/beta fold hydrolase [Microbacterium sp. 22242]|uniref:alpha/beta fold hydrolase n=1 Tax=Microbacterium sp. 22242 TaxID=3453896 RepID=UPI003F86D90E
MIPALSFTAPIGPEGAPLLVLGPSLGTSAILWERTLPQLARRHRVVAWDLPGHGASAPAAEPFTVGELADAVADGIRGLGGMTVRYAGVSLGGAVGLELCLRHPGLVSAAAILASGAQLVTPESWTDRAAQVRTQSTSSLIIGSAQRWFAPESIARDPELTGRLLHTLQDADDESYALCCEALAVFDVRDRLGAIDVPVLALWGEHDQVAPESKAREVAEGVRHGDVLEVRDAAHLPPAEQPQTTAALLDDFFAAAHAEPVAAEPGDAEPAAAERTRP